MFCYDILTCTQYIVFHVIHVARICGTRGKGKREGEHAVYGNDKTTLEWKVVLYILLQDDFQVKFIYSTKSEKHKGGESTSVKSEWNTDMEGRFIYVIIIISISCIHKFIFYVL